MRYAMIMAGGAGTRLWPMSRRSRPKQLLQFIHGKSLLEIAADRLEHVVGAQHQLICTNESHRAAIRQSLPRFSDEQILGEPEGRDTVNAVGFTAAVLAARDPDAVFAVLTADHIIQPIEEFQQKLDLGFSLVEQKPSRIVTFSIKPTFPATAYGYVERGAPIPGRDNAFTVKQFVEKPNIATAEQYVKAGTFGWNSGMFIFHAQQFMEALKRFKPECYDGLAQIGKAWGTPDQQRVLNDVYPKLPKISVDYAIMEPASHDHEIEVCTVAFDIQWLDVGSWPSYAQTIVPDADENRSNVNAINIGSRGVLAVSDDPDHTFATINCHNLIIIRTKDVTMVCPSEDAERVKQLVEQADASLR